MTTPQPACPVCGIPIEPWRLPQPNEVLAGPCLRCSTPLVVSCEAVDVRYRVAAVEQEKA